MTQGHESLFANDENLSSYTPQIGLTFNPVHLNSSKYEFSLSIKGGYLFARADGFGKKDCERQDHHNSFTACSKSVLSIAPIISVLDRLRFKPFFNISPLKPDG